MVSRLRYAAILTLCLAATASTGRTYAQVVIGSEAPLISAAVASGSAGETLIEEDDVRTWLTYLSSDLLQGRQVFTEGFGLAASYVSERLREFGVRPLGESGTYFQTVRWRGYDVERKSTVTVTAGGETRTFNYGDHFTLGTMPGGPQSLTFNGVEFAGYGLVSVGAGASHNDFAGRDVRGRLVTYLPGVPKALEAPDAPRTGRGTAGDRGLPNFILQSFGVGGVVAFTSATIRTAAAAAPEPASGGGAGRAAGAGRAGGAPRPDVSTVSDVTVPVPPTITGDPAFFEFLFRTSPVPFADLRAMAERGDPLPALTLRDVTVRVKVENDYKLLSTQLSQNVVGMVEGTDPTLKDTYVFIGAHLDHVGYSAIGDDAKGRVNTPLDQDRIWNGADDDGSGSAAVLALAKAFATGPKPKRSVVFVWHTGEEANLLGSRHMAESPVVPLDKIQAELNIDMIGRNRDDKDDQIDTVYVIGADRISTDLHNVLEETNARAERPLTIDYEFNDPGDSNSFYTRSDHYSYASKGIPIAFFFTGVHPDYHANSDSVEKILFPKLVRITRWIYQSAFDIADRTTPLVRDNLGPRSGRGFSGRLPANR